MRSMEIKQAKKEALENIGDGILMIFFSSYFSYSILSTLWENGDNLVKIFAISFVTCIMAVFISGIGNLINGIKKLNIIKYVQSAPCIDDKVLEEMQSKMLNIGRLAALTFFLGAILFFAIIVLLFVAAYFHIY